jgi:hypothetical protein
MLKADLSMHQGCIRSPSPLFLIETKRDDETAIINLSPMTEDRIRRDKAYDEDTPYR